MRPVFLSSSAALRSARLAAPACPGRRTLGTVCLIGLLAAGCTVGPDFSTPTAPPGLDYRTANQPAATAASPGPLGESQHFSTAAPLSARWWTDFGSPALDRLVEQALAASPTLAVASARLREAAENLQAETGGRLYPRIDAGLGANRERISTAAFGNPNPTSNLFTLHNASVNVSYAFDFSGAIWRALEGARAAVDFQAWQLEAARLSVAANLVTSAIAEASARTQLESAGRVVQTQEALLTLLERQATLGGIARGEILAQQAQLAQARSALPGLSRQASVARHQMALLAGRSPTDPDLPTFTLADFSLPGQLPLSVPSELLRQRPDIRAAEAQWHQASAAFGVATANLYPQLNLSATVGSQTLTPGALFGPGTWISSMAASALQPVFRGGELQARRRAAQAVFEGAEAQYRQTVLLAFQNVADVMRALDEDARFLATQADAARSAAQSHALALGQQALGALAQPAVLNARRNEQASELSLAQARAARLADTAALFQALGGGWWNRPDGAGPQVAAGSGSPAAPVPAPALPDTSSRTSP